MVFHPSVWCKYTSSSSNASTTFTLTIPDSLCLLNVYWDKNDQLLEMNPFDRELIKLLGCSILPALSSIAAVYRSQIFLRLKFSRHICKWSCHAAYRFVLINTQTLTLLSHPHILENYGAIWKVKDLQKTIHTSKVAGWKSPINRIYGRSAGDGPLHLLQLYKHYGKFNDNQLWKNCKGSACLHHSTPNRIVISCGMKISLLLTGI